MLETIAYISGILGIIASLIEILQFFKVLNLKYKFIIFIVTAVCTALCFSVFYIIDTRRENQKIEEVKQNALIKDAKTTAQSIIITGYEESGDYLGYLIQITGFYNRHKEIYKTEYETYKKQLDSWMAFFEDSRKNDKYFQGYSTELSELKGLVSSGKDQLELIYEPS